MQLITSCLPDRLSLAEFLQEEQPPVLVMQSRKKHIRQRTESALASQASEAREPCGLSPWEDLRMWQWGHAGGNLQAKPSGHQVFLSRCSIIGFISGLCSDVMESTARRHRWNVLFFMEITS